MKSSLSNQIRSQLEEEVLAALELEVEEKLKEKVLQDLEAERQTLEDAKNQFQQEVGLLKLQKSFFFNFGLRYYWTYWTMSFGQPK